ncbi:cation/H(+) antiporter 3-like [Hibiscus syriacus]|uniref:cation/H(+) antiporter 3-like n=1 Tax=Hibiscus syriacus TaxID=106335 RepID=UPI0019211CD7|nr:cation/H(+) antiporter 3-like [Hibiscus syriacus]
MAEAPSPPPQPLPFENETVKVCTTFPPRVNSVGIWENPTSPLEIFRYSLPLLEIEMLVVFFVTRLIYFILKPLGVTLFASQMFAGMMLGPAVLGRVHDKMFTKELGIGIMDTAATFGFGMFLFVMGVKMDFKMAFRTTRRATVIVCLLSELKIVNSELGRLALSSASISDFSSLFLIYITSLVKLWVESPASMVQHVVIMLLFIVVVFWGFRQSMFWMIKVTPEGRPIKGAHIVIIMMLALWCGIFTHWHNESPLLGIFLFGCAVPDGPPLGSALVEKFECFVNGAFLAIYVTTRTMRVDPIATVSDPIARKFSIIFPILTFLAKFIFCFVASFWKLMPLRDSLAFALIMCSKGVVELAYFSSFRDNQMVSNETFSVLVLFILVKATIIPILVKYLYDPISRKYIGYQTRNLMYLKPNAELRILACIHRPEHVQALIDVLDITYPTKESPNFVYALHLIQLTGRASPVFIAHHENPTVDSFENIVAFNHYQQNNWGLVKVNAFTAISPPKLMHEDIFNMVLENHISFILVPFHRKWCIEGYFEAENNVIRNLNRNVLDQVPCSIGILVDRRRKLSSSRLSSYFVGMLFIGGKDDREALTLANRMARHPRVKLTVIHLCSEKDHGNVKDWDAMLDAEILKGIKLIEVGNIKYMGQVSNNGMQTATTIRSLVDDFDLMIVGRRYGVDSVQTKGLTEWSEFPELGVIGDILSSPDLDTRASVLVVQQHVGRH